MTGKDDVRPTRLAPVIEANVDNVMGMIIEDITFPSGLVGAEPAAPIVPQVAAAATVPEAPVAPVIRRLAPTVGVDWSNILPVMSCLVKANADLSIRCSSLRLS